MCLRTCGPEMHVTYAHCTVTLSGRVLISLLLFQLPVISRFCACLLHRPVAWNEEISKLCDTFIAALMKQIGAHQTEVTGYCVLHDL
jgi:hypothetical protein